MATTYSRIYALLKKSKTNQEWFEIDAFIKNIRERKLREFKIRGDGSKVDDFMKKESILKLINLMSELELIDIRSEEQQMALSSKGKKCLENEDKYKLNLRSSIKSLLQRKSLPYNVISKTIKEIELPEVPDADTIHDHLKEIDHQIDKVSLRQFLFLYACAEGISRKMRCHYLEV